MNTTVRVVIASAVAALVAVLGAVAGAAASDNKDDCTAAAQAADRALQRAMSTSLTLAQNNDPARVLYDARALTEALAEYEQPRKSCSDITGQLDDAMTDR